MINDLKRDFGEKIVVVDECIRRKPGVKSIDEIRKDPSAYLEFQFTVIREKFEAEQEVVKLHPNSVILTDRSLADSFFYYVFYVDKSQLTRRNLERYAEFFKWLYFKTVTTASFYDHIFLFKPVDLKEVDLLRPGNLDLLQDVEFFFIRTLVHGFYKNVPVTELSVTNETDVNTAYSIVDAYVSKS